MQQLRIKKWDEGRKEIKVHRQAGKFLVLNNLIKIINTCQK